MPESGNLVLTGVSVGLLVVVLLCHITLHKGAHLRYQSNKDIIWKQPEELDQTYPNLIGSRQWDLDYLSAEAVLHRLKFQSDAALTIDDQSAAVFEQTCAKLGGPLTDDEAQRVAVLVRKGWPMAGAELAPLLLRFCSYNAEYQASLIELNRAAPPQRLELLKSSAATNRKRQRLFFGQGLAEKLFAKRNARTDYLNTRRLVNANPDLNPQQKKAALAQLERDYQAAKDTGE